MAKQRRKDDHVREVQMYTQTIDITQNQGALEGLMNSTGAGQYKQHQQVSPPTLVKAHGTKV